MSIVRIEQNSVNTFNLNKNNHILDIFGPCVVLFYVFKKKNNYYLRYAHFDNSINFKDVKGFLKENKKFFIFGGFNNLNSEDLLNKIIKYSKRKRIILLNERNLPKSIGRINSLELKNNILFLYSLENKSIELYLLDLLNIFEIN